MFLQNPVQSTGMRRVYCDSMMKWDGLTGDLFVMLFRPFVGPVSGERRGGDRPRHLALGCE